MDTKLAKFELHLEDGPWAEVDSYGEQITIRFDWHGPNQRWYLTQDEARQVARAIFSRLEDLA